VCVWKGGEKGNLGDQLNFVRQIPELRVHCMNHTKLEFRDMKIIGFTIR